MLSRWEVVLATRSLLPFLDLRARLHRAGSCRHPITKPVSAAGLRGDAMHGCLWSEPRHTSWSAMTLQTQTHRMAGQGHWSRTLEHCAETAGSTLAMKCEKHQATRNLPHLPQDGPFSAAKQLSCHFSKASAQCCARGRVPKSKAILI